jgi:hypothetical protein
MTTPRGRNSHCIFTISVILFSAAIKLIVKTAEKMGRGPVTISGIRQPPTRAGRHDYYSKVSAEWTLDVTRYRTTDLLVIYEVQADKVKKFGPEEKGKYKIALRSTLNLSQQ